jgi:hypothetical protein
MRIVAVARSKVNSAAKPHATRAGDIFLGTNRAEFRELAFEYGLHLYHQLLVIVTVRMYGFLVVKYLQVEMADIGLRPRRRGIPELLFSNRHLKK